MDYQQLQLTVNQLVSDKIAAGEMFTCYDITKEIRDNNPCTGYIAHNDVRDIIHRQIYPNMRTYYRTLIQIDVGAGIVQETYVFHPYDVDAETHPLSINQPTQDDSDDDITDNVVAEEDVVESTAEGRVTVPSKLLDKATNDKGECIIKFDGMTITRKRNSDGRIRITVDSVNTDYKVSYDKASNVITIDAL